MLNDGVELVEDVLDGLGCLFLGLVVLIVLAGVAGTVLAALPPMVAWLLVVGVLLAAAWGIWRR